MYQINIVAYSQSVMVALGHPGLKGSENSQSGRGDQTNYTAQEYCLMLHWYRKTSSIGRTKSQNLNVYCILLQLSSLNPLKPAVKLRMKM